MGIDVAQQLYNSVDASLQSTLADGIAKVMLGVSAIFGTFWLLNFTFRSIFWLYQGMTVAFREIVIEIAKVAFIAGCAWNVGWYLQTIVPFVSGFPVWMGNILSGEENTQINQIDTLISTYIVTLGDLIGAMKFNIFKTEFSDIYLGVQAVLIYLVAGIPFILVAVGTLFVLKVSVTILLAVGPLFIAFALFDKTKQWFWGWISLISGFMLTEVLFSIVLALEIGFINTVVIKEGVVDTSLAGNVSLLIYFASFTVLATEIPSYAASIMGGTPVSAQGFGGMISKGTGFSSAINGARGVAKIANKFKPKGKNNIE
jgi:type IV secretion system protein VirB6